MTEVELGEYRIGVATEFGPRLVGLRWKDGPEVLVSLGPDSKIDHPGGTYHFRGGHRLWAAPEVAGVTYASEDHECSVRIDGDRVTVTGPTDSAGIIKEITVTAIAEALEISHTISGGREMAAWAITQLPLGGIALLALSDTDTAPLPNRQLVLWPYTSVDDDRLRLNDRMVTVEATDGAAVKLGAGPGPGHLGYLRDGQLFIKTMVTASSGTVPDLGATAQIYVGQGFCELETVGGLADREAKVIERWQIVPCRERDEAMSLVHAGAGT